MSVWDSFIERREKEQKDEAKKTIVDTITSLEREGDITFCGEACALNHGKTSDGKYCADCCDVKIPYYESARKLRSFLQDTGNMEREALSLHD